MGKTLATIVFLCSMFNTDCSYSVNMGNYEHYRREKIDNYVAVSAFPVGIPEPNTGALFVLGLTGLAFYTSRRNKTGK